MKNPASFIHFKFATHMWNVHRISCYDMTIRELRRLHRYFHCPPGPVAHNFACRFRFVPRRWPRSESRAWRRMAKRQWRRRRSSSGGSRSVVSRTR